MPGANPPQRGWIRKTDVQPALAAAMAAPLKQQQQQTGTEEIKRHEQRGRQLSAAGRRQLFEAGKLKSNANVLAGERKYGDAIALTIKAYESCKEILGEDEPFTAAAANRLGFFYLKSGDYRQAEAWSAKTAEVCKRVFGAQHPIYSAVLNNLAQAYFYQRTYDQAEPLFRQALAIRKAGLGERHRETIQRLNSLRELLEKSAEQHEAAADFAAAGKQREEILAIQTTVLGPQHWRVANPRLDFGPRRADEEVVRRRAPAVS